MLLSLSTILDESKIALEVMVFGICAGALLAFTLYFFRQKILGSLVKALLLDALGAENAKTLDELGKNKAIYRHSLGDNSVLRRYVSVIGSSLPLDAQGQPDFNSARFYITEENTEGAISRYHKDVKIYIYILGILAICALGVGVYFVIPLLLSII